MSAPCTAQSRESGQAHYNLTAAECQPPIVVADQVDADQVGLFHPLFDKTDVSHTSRIQREARDHIFVIAHEIKRGDGKPEYVAMPWL